MRSRGTEAAARRSAVESAPIAARGSSKAPPIATRGLAAEAATRRAAEAAAVSTGGITTARRPCVEPATVPGRAAVPEARTWATRPGGPAEACAWRGAAESTAGAEGRTPVRAAAWAAIATRAAIVEPRSSAITAALRTRIPTPPRAPFGLRLSRLPARLAPLRRPHEPALGVEMLLGLTEQEGAAALGARDLLIAHRFLSSGGEGLKMPFVQRAIRQAGVREIAVVSGRRRKGRAWCRERVGIVQVLTWWALPSSAPHAVSEPRLTRS